MFADVLALCLAEIGLPGQVYIAQKDSGGLLDQVSQLYKYKGNALFGLRHSLRQESGGFFQLGIPGVKVEDTGCRESHALVCRLLLLRLPALISQPACYHAGVVGLAGSHQAAPQLPSTP